MKPFWLAQEVCGDAQALEDQPENFPGQRRDNMPIRSRRQQFSIQLVVAVAGVSLGLRLKLQRCLEVGIDSGNSRADAAGDLIG